MPIGRSDGGSMAAALQINLSTLIAIILSLSEMALLYP
jgi:hypothetical protein